MGVCLVFIITLFFRMLNANSVDQDQMLHSVVSDLDLHCLPMSFYGMLGLYGLTLSSLGKNSSR